LGILARFEGEFFKLCKQRALHALLTFTAAGLALGATILAPLRRNAAGVETLDLSGEDRILAALTAAFLAPVDAALLGKLRRACALWTLGEKSLAQIHLAGLRLPPIDADEALRLHLADRLMAEGFAPRELCKELGFELPAGLKKYSPDQPRDEQGRWTDGAGGGGSSAPLSPTMSGRAAPSRPAARTAARTARRTSSTPNVALSARSRRRKTSATAGPLIRWAQRPFLSVRGRVRPQGPAPSPPIL